MTSDVDAAPPSQTEASQVSPPVAASGEAPIQEAQATEASHEAGGAEEQKTRIKIGTQRPGVAVPRIQPRAKVAFRTPAVSSPHVESPSAEPQAEKPAHSGPPSEGEAKAKPPVLPREGGSQFIKPGAKRSKFEVSAPPMAKVERPNIRADLSPELEAELQAALGEQSLEELIGADSPEATSGQTAGELLEVESRHKGTIVRIFRDNVFVDLGGRNQGALILHTLPQEPQPGDVMDVVVTKFNADDGLYELTAVGASVDIGDWSDISEGITVDARITGHNKGGLECEVNKIRGFIPAGQISIYRVENFEEFVGQNWACIVVEANRDRRNLVLSRRGVLEREQAEAKEKLLAELAVGQEREGVVRNIRDFGAFVDLGGIDGMIHVSQMSWDRVKHPSEVLTLGQKVKVKIQKIDPETHKISLAYRDLFESPWVNATSKYPVTSKVTGTVSKIMDFGAFVKLEPGIEGLVHISELSFKRVHRVSDIVQEGQQIEAKVLSIDPENQRISLSMKAFEARPEPTKSESNAASEAPAAEAERAPPTKKKKEPPLRGGLGRSPLAEKFGLKW